MTKDRVLFEADGLPIFQDLTCATQAEVLAYPRGCVRLIEDSATELVRNTARLSASISAAIV